MNEIEARQLFGHQKQQDLFCKLLQKKAVPHCFLVTGDEGVGKLTFAHLATRLLKEPVTSFREIDFTSPIQRQYKQGVLASHYTLSDDGNYKVEDLTPVFQFLQRKADENTYKTLIISNAHQLNMFGQNALLKQLEEPSDRTVIFLITSQPANILPTIASRTMRISLSGLNEAEMAAFISANQISISSDAINFYQQYTNGRPGALMRAVESDLFSLHQQVFNTLKTFLSNQDNELFSLFFNQKDNVLKTHIIQLIFHIIHQAICRKNELELPTSLTTDTWHAWAKKHQNYTTQTLDIDHLFTSMLTQLKEGFAA